MQAVTHFAIGALLAAVIVGPPAPRAAEPDAASAAGDGGTKRDRGWPRWIALTALAAVLAALSHPLMDDLAGATYHPPEPDFTSPVWVIYHAIVYAAALPVAWLHRRRIVVVIASLGPDLGDWLIARPFGVWEPGKAHDAFRAIPGIAPVSRWLRDTLPDLRHEPLACLPELLLVAGLLLAVRAIDRRRAPPATEPAEPCPDDSPT